MHSFLDWISWTTWAFWSFANITAALYGALVLHDRGFTAIFIGNAACTAAVTLIAAIKHFSAASGARSG